MVGGEGGGDGAWDNGIQKWKAKKWYKKRKDKESVRWRDGKEKEGK